MDAATREFIRHGSEATRPGNSAHTKNCFSDPPQDAARLSHTRDTNSSLVDAAQNFLIRIKSKCDRLMRSEELFARGYK
jgi:hypothetical protein